jgi:hypothetical protein
VGHDRRRYMHDAEPLVDAIGEFLVALLLTARDGGTFDGLPKAARCELGVEDPYTPWGWPAYEERGKQNLA